MRPMPLFSICFLLLLLSGATGSRAEILKAHEPRYAEAVLAYNAKKYEESIRILNSLLKEAPDLVEFLELKALALKSAKNDAESQKTYEALIDAKTRTGAPESEIAPYHFELGVIQFRSKDPKSSRAHFEVALRHHFNEPASHFFLGMIAFQESDPALAVAHFEPAARSGASDLKAPALFYLAQSYLRQNDSSRALSSFSEARSATENATDELGKSIHSACAQVLNPLDQSRKFASIALSMAYDSNVQALPNSLDGTLAFNKSSLKNLLQAGFGYMSSPTQTFQWVPNYRLLFNHNTNRDTREGEFLSQYFSLYLNHKPLERSAVGLKLDTSLTFQNQFDSGSTTESTFRVFSVTGATGAYYRTAFLDDWTANLEVSVGPQRYFGDQNVVSQDWRTGSALSARAGFARASLGKYLNPSFFVGYLKNSTSGNEFYSKGVSFTLSDGLIFSDRVRGSISFTYAPTFYERRTPAIRVDRNSSLSAEASYQLNPKWTLIADFSVAYNQSTVTDIYEYRRWTSSVGASYSFY
ncbi:MAG: hypothetical protein EBX52_02985 [Proteobacteria bacterium]|nr:hypothetical protein [Pseudomonadota bacterium]